MENDPNLTTLEHLTDEQVYAMIVQLNGCDQPIIIECLRRLIKNTREAFNMSHTIEERVKGEQFVEFRVEKHTTLEEMIKFYEAQTRDVKFELCHKNSLRTFHKFREYMDSIGEKELIVRR